MMKRAQQEKVAGRGHTEGSNVPRSWEKPPLNWVKINVDAALFGSENCIGLGMIVRDAAGNFIMARSRKQENLVPLREAEAMCLKEALSWMKGKGFHKCIFETDSQVLAQACKVAEILIFMPLLVIVLIVLSTMMTCKFVCS